MPVSEATPGPSAHVPRSSKESIVTMTQDMRVRNGARVACPVQSLADKLLLPCNMGMDDIYTVLGIFVTTLRSLERRGLLFEKRLKQLLIAACL